jgi:hypothetical protein
VWIWQRWYLGNATVPAGISYFSTRSNLKFHKRFKIKSGRILGLILEPLTKRTFKKFEFLDMLKFFGELV